MLCVCVCVCVIVVRQTMITPHNIPWTTVTHKRDAAVANPNVQTTQYVCKKRTDTITSFYNENVFTECTLPGKAASGA